MPDGFFSFRELDRRRVSIILERSLQDLVDRRAPITAIQFRLACRGPAGVRVTFEFIYIYIYISENLNHNNGFVNKHLFSFHIIGVFVSSHHGIN